MGENTKIDGREMGVLKTAARRIGVDFSAYIAHRAAGKHWCTVCRAWHLAEAFGLDANRLGGRAARCLASRHTGRPRGWHAMPNTNPLTGRPGPAKNERRDDDRQQARQTVALEVRCGRMPHPNTKPCVDCGHAHRPGSRRHEYDHYLGYSPEHHLDVQSVCTLCHHRRTRERGELIQARDAGGRYATP